MANRQVSIDASEEKLKELENRLKTDIDFIQAVADDPKTALAEYGITLDDVSADSIKVHFSELAAGGPGASPVAVAIGVAVAVALP